MKKYATFIYALLLLPFAISCNKGTEDPHGPVNTKSLIQGFFDANKIFVEPVSGFVVSKKTNHITPDARFDSPEYFELKHGVGMHISFGNEGVGRGLIRSGTAAYDKNTRAIGDTAFNSGTIVGLSYDGRIISIVDTIESIVITCDKDIDESHPAGSSLNDIFSVYFEDPYCVIKNGYKPCKGANFFTLGLIDPNFAYSIYGAKVSEVDLSKKYFTGVEWVLILETAPTVKDEYTFTVSVKPRHGKTLTEKARLPIKLEGR